MEGYTLGLDLGTSSIGWAVVFDHPLKGQIVPSKKGDTPGCGVRHFPEPIDPKKNTPNNQRRREKRGVRRVLRRRRQRKQELIRKLRGAGLYPSSLEELAELEKNLQDQEGAPPQLRLYELRVRALTTPITAHEFGRILLHLSHRRGFKSNRKGGEVVLDVPQQSTESPKKKRAPKKAPKSPLYDSIAELRTHMKDKGSVTLGQHLYQIGTGTIGLPQKIKQEGQTALIDENQIRGRFLLRSMVEEEFDLLWNSQLPHIPVLADVALRERVRRILFWQRPLRSSTRLIGRCECLPNLPRCPRANWHAQQFRILKEVNNLRIHNPDGTTTELTPSQRNDIFRELSRSEKLEFSKMMKIARSGSNEPTEGYEFNLEIGSRPNGRGGNRGKKSEGVSPTKARKSLKGNFIEAALVGILGNGWDIRQEEQKATIRTLLCEIDDPNELMKSLRDQHNISDEDARALASIKLAEGYVAYSLEAIKRMIVKFEEGMKEELGIREYEARERCGFNSRAEQRVYKLLPLPRKADGRPLTNNPLVGRALHEVRKIVNAVIREYGLPDKIVVELVRDAKVSLAQRKELQEQQNANRDDKERIRDELRGWPAFKERHREPSGADVLAHRLWEQQGKRSPYSGKCIGRTEMERFFAGEGILQIDHILPRKRSLDDSASNKCLCFRDENVEKGERTPREWKKAVSEEAYQKMLENVSHMKEHGMPWNKRRRFSQEEVKLDTYVARQLDDTAFIARAVRSYLQCLYRNTPEERARRVVSISGQKTSELRWNWGLDTILSADGREVKNRLDLRHHAIDAIVVALTTEKRLFDLATHAKRGPKDDPLNEPWTGFRGAVAIAISKINVSHRVQRKIAGSLHDDFFYGPTGDPELFTRRKLLTDLTPRMARDICDKKIRELVLDRLRKHSVDPDAQGTIGKAVWHEPLRINEKSPRIRRVRVVFREPTMRQIREKQPAHRAYVLPSGNHHAEIYRYTSGPSSGEQDGKVIPTIDVMKRRNERVSIICRDFGPGTEFVMSLSINEMLLVELDGAESLHRVQKMDVNGSIILRPHTYGGEVSDRDKPPFILRKAITTLRGKKVTVDPLGRIRSDDMPHGGLAADSIDNRVMELARRRVKDPAHNSASWIKMQMKRLGIPHLGAQLSAAIRHLRAND